MVLDGRRALRPAGAPRIVGSVARSGNGEMDYHERLDEAARAAWEAFGFGPGDVDLVELHDATSAEELFSLESLGFFEPRRGRPGHLAGDTTIGGAGLTVNPSGGLVGRGHPLGATGFAQIVELATQLRGRAGDRQVTGPGWGWPSTPGGDRGRRRVRGDPRRRRAGTLNVPGITVMGWGINVPDKILTNDDLSARLDTNDAWIVERTGIRERRMGGITSGWPSRPGGPRSSGPASGPRTSTWWSSPRPPPTPWCRAPRPPSRTVSASPVAPSTSTPPARASSTGWWWRPA